MKPRPPITGILLYLGLFSLAIFSVFLFGIFPVPSISPQTFSVLFATTLFCGAFLFQTLGKSTMGYLTVAAFVLFLLCAALVLLSGWGASGCFAVFWIFAFMWLLAMAGALAAMWCQKKWPSAKARRIRIQTVPSLAVATCLGFYLYGAGNTIRSEILAKKLSAPDLRCNAAALQVTRVVPELQAPVTAGTNLIWCASFQLAWNKMEDLLGEEIHLSGDEPDFLTRLNRRNISGKYLDPETYLAVAGSYTPDFIKQVNAEIKTRFGSGTFEPEPYPETDAQQRLAAFGYLSANLPFKYAFQQTDEPLNFNGVQVKAFTLPHGAGSATRTDHAQQQVRVWYPPEKEAFIVELRTKQSKHHLILAQVSPEATLGETAEKLRRYIDTSSSEPLSPNQKLIVPLFNYDITRKYTELAGSRLSIKNPEYGNGKIERAEQTIRFQLDERGAVLQSSASVVCVFCAPPTDCIFDKPFLLMLRYGDSPQPYFAMWVDNAEILVKPNPAQN